MGQTESVIVGIGWKQRGTRKDTVDAIVHGNRNVWSLFSL